MIRNKIVTRDPKDSVSSWAGRFDRVTGSAPLIDDAMAAGFPATAIRTGAWFSPNQRQVKNTVKQKLIAWCEGNLPLADFFVGTYEEGIVMMFSDETHMAMFKLCCGDEYQINLNEIGHVK